MLSYIMLTASVVMFGNQFFFNLLYEKNSSGTVRSSLLFTMGSSLAGLFVLLLINGLNFDFTPFSLLMAVVNALNNAAFIHCSLKALGKVNLSRYSVFSMLGGMLLPFIAGVLFFDEPLGLPKLLCLVCIAFAVLITLKDRNDRSGMIYCLAVFIFNGMAGVLAKIFQFFPYEKCSEAFFSVLCAAATALLAAIPLLFMKKGKEEKPLNRTAILAMSGCGILGRVGNFLLLLALAELPASVQYPFVTGGVIAVSTVIAFITKQRPSKAEIISMVLSLIGVTALMFV